ncbi:hypothetical protein BAGQ_0976 [Bacillus velezensis]|nr:hypothetical protein BCBMB205_08820 [Bacillus velezensis]ARZ57212.1 hypothetical protein BAGQ_0976 [Bacillus velezensis]
MQEEIKRQSDDVARRIIDGGRFLRFHFRGNSGSEGGYSPAFLSA